MNSNAKNIIDLYGTYQQVNLVICEFVCICLCVNVYVHICAYMSICYNFLCTSAKIWGVFKNIEIEITMNKTLIFFKIVIFASSIFIYSCELTIIWSNSANPFLLWCKAVLFYFFYVLYTSKSYFWDKKSNRARSCEYRECIRLGAVL